MVPTALHGRMRRPRVRAQKGMWHHPTHCLPVFTTLPLHTSAVLGGWVGKTTKEMVVYWWGHAVQVSAALEHNKCPGMDCGPACMLAAPQGHPQ